MFVTSCVEVLAMLRLLTPVVTFSRAAPLPARNLLVLQVRVFLQSCLMMMWVPSVSSRKGPCWLLWSHEAPSVPCQCAFEVRCAVLRRPVNGLAAAASSAVKRAAMPIRLQLRLRVQGREAPGSRCLCARLAGCGNRRPPLLWNALLRFAELSAGWLAVQ